MNNKALLFLFLCLFLGACSDDNEDSGNGGGTPPEDRTEAQAWIEDTMRKEYFWNSDIPDSDKLDYSKEEPKAFFTSLLSKKDGKTRNGNHYYYSYIEEVTASSRSTIQPGYSYGIEFATVTFGKSQETMRALVLYVLPESPAFKKIERGQWISEINGKPLTRNNVYSLLGGAECELTIEDYDHEYENGRFINPRKVSIKEARPLDDNPVHTWDIITAPHTGKKVGYLVYNHFTDGRKEGDFSYDNDLRTRSNFFKGVDEFVLDLRYNNGGLLSSARLLCAILAPSDALGKNFGYLKFNTGKTSAFDVNKNLLLPGGTNLNLKTLYVLVSGQSASASEMVINSLSPYMKVVLIGERTEGKNVGSSPFTSKDKAWKLHPITCQIYNSEHFTDYANGFLPDYTQYDVFEPLDDGYSDLLEVLPLGNPKERMLSTALAIIDGEYTDTRSVKSVGKSTYEKVGEYSIDRKATNGVIIE